MDFEALQNAYTQVEEAAREAGIVSQATGNAFANLLNSLAADMRNAQNGA